MLTVTEGKHGDLGADHALLNDNGGAGGTKLFVLHHLTHGLLGLLHRSGNHHALAQSQTVGLDHDGRTLRTDVGQRLVKVCKGLVPGSGDVVLFHQFLGKGLAGLDDSGVGPGAEGGDACRLQSVHHAQGQRIVRGHHDKVHGILFGPLDHSLYIGGLDGHAGGHLCNAGVAGSAVELCDTGRLGQLPADGVLTAATADD